MPTNANPPTSRIHDDGIVQIHGHDRRSTDGRQANNQRSGLIPLKVIVPRLPSRMKQGDRFPGQGILSTDSTAFELVAATTGKTEVLKKWFLRPGPAE